jgi:hypothetical protein
MNKTGRLIADFYAGGCIGTFAILGIGNITNALQLSFNNTYEDGIAIRVSSFIIYGLASVIKAGTYAAIWPLFWPYALMKMHTNKPKYVRIIGSRFGYYNKYGFYPHFIPWEHSLLTEEKVE